MEKQSYICCELIFDKYPKAIQWRKSIVFSNNDGTNGWIHQKSALGTLPSIGDKN